MPSFARAITLALGITSYAQAALKIELLADITRDGKIDAQDQKTKEADPQKSALFLANIGDTNERCKREFGSQDSAKNLMLCNDATGDQLRNADYLARVILSPCSESLGESAYGQISASHQNVRIFYHTGEGWEYVKEGFKFKAEDLKKGLQLGIDSRDVRRRDWDGNVKLTMQVQDQEETAKDFINFQLAPVLAHHVLQNPDTLYTVAPLEELKGQRHFVDELEERKTEAGLEKPLHLLSKMTDVWAQDFFKPGYTSMPGPSGPVSLRIMITSAQKRPESHRLIFQEERSSSVGAVQPLGLGVDTDSFRGMDSMGNVDMIPPFSHGGNNYPAGMPIIGVDGNEKPMIRDFFADQGTPALEVDSGWLGVGHIDEYLQFLPNPDPEKASEWILAVNDPEAGLKVLKDLQKDDGELYDDTTIDQLLKTPNLDAFAVFCGDRTRETIEKIKTATGINDDRIIRIPVVYRPVVKSDEERPKVPNSAGLQSSAAVPQSENLNFAIGNLKALSVFPNTINGLVFADNKVLAPDPWGPYIGGDILKGHVINAYTEAGFEMLFMDDFESHHLSHGDVHCGTNMARDASQPWW